MKFKLSIYLLLLTQLFSCNPTINQENQDVGCHSKRLSNKQKSENSLFLGFYYGMTPSEFEKEEQSLIKSGTLLQYDGAKTLLHSDSKTKFLFVVNNNGPEKCFFILTPSFEGCTLHAIDLEYIPTYGVTALFKESGKSQEVPDLTTANSIEKAYRERYGKPITREGHFIGGYNQYTWREKTKEINLYKVFGTTQDMQGNDFRQISGIRIGYESIEYNRKTKFSHDSIKNIERKKMLKQVEDGKESI